MNTINSAVCTQSYSGTGFSREEAGVIAISSAA
jgi:hypothetical protein